MLVALFLFYFLFPYLLVDNSYDIGCDFRLPTIQLLLLPIAIAQNQIQMRIVLF